ncbi:MAG: phosphatase PAP2 family protein [Bacilli bacterium]|nr:phosphatase PAP2 family protein [Bacilli bacterium]
MINFLKKHKLKIIIILLLIVITIITTKIVTNKPIFIDVIAHTVFVKKLRSPFLNPIMKLFTRLSNSEGIIIFTVLVFIFIKNKKIAITVPLNVIFATLINQLLKHLIKRPRPLGYRLIKIGGYSFPSGHAMVSMAFYGYLLYLVCTSIKEKKIKIILASILIFIIIMVGISRIYLGVHYCSDIITGYSISIIYLIIYTKLLKYLKSQNIP